MRRLLLFASAAIALVLLMVLSAGDLSRRVRSSLWKSQADATSGSASTRVETMLAARYHLRNRTNQFFERATKKQEYVPAGPPSHGLGARQATVAHCPRACSHNPARFADDARADVVTGKK